jgi:hypothetical protein
MFVLWGWRGKVIPGKMLSNQRCEHCGSGSLRAHTVVNYVHMFWIPLFPVGKQIATECTHCKAVQKGKEVSKAIKEEAARQQAIAPIPKYLFVGTVALIAFAGFLYYNVQTQRARTADYVASPITGDCFVVNYEEVFGVSEDDLRYGVMRVNFASSDSVAFAVGSWAYEYTSDAGSAVKDGDIDSPEYWVAGEVMFGRDELVAMYDADLVQRVIRR